MTVGGVVDPDGLPVTSCVFEYGTTSGYGQEKECSANPGSGSGPVAVSANLAGLEPLTRYHFRLKVANANGSDEGQDRTFLSRAGRGLRRGGIGCVFGQRAVQRAGDPGVRIRRSTSNTGPACPMGRVCRSRMGISAGV